MNTITFEKFTEKHIDEAVRLALAELSAERKHCPDIPNEDYTEMLTGMLHWLCSQSYGKAAVQEGRLVGYLLFAGPWDGFFGDVKGVFSPLSGSAFSYECTDRGRLASQLFQSVADDFVHDGVYSVAVCRFAHDEETARSFILNGFGIRCCDAVRELSEMKLAATENACFSELLREEFIKIKPLELGLVRHLEKAPVFYPTDMNDPDSWFDWWSGREGLRIFAAEADGKTIGFIAVTTDGENYITETERMANICGAFFDTAYRGGGLAQSLLSYICETLKSEGITHLGVDCETLNPTALNFWGKYFDHYTYSYARRIDERIGR